MTSEESMFGFDIFKPKNKRTINKDTGCYCTYAQKTVGDGCDKCNPEMAIDIKRRNSLRCFDCVNDILNIDCRLALTHDIDDPYYCKYYNRKWWKFWRKK